MDYLRVHRDPTGIGRKRHWDVQLPRTGLMGIYSHLRSPTLRKLPYFSISCRKVLEKK